MDVPFNRSVTPKCSCINSFVVHGVQDTTQICDKKPKFCCPYPACDYGICQKYNRLLSSNKQDLNIIETFTHSKLSFHHIDIDDENDPHIYPQAESIPGENDGMNLATNILQNQDNLLMDPVPHELEDFIEEDMESMDDCNWEAEEDSVNTSDSDQDSEISSTCHNGAIDNTSENREEIPTTSAGHIPLDIISKHSIIPLHVILNNCGSLLVRTAHKLRPSKNGRNFLQTIVSRSPGKHIPILYPEGMLFPSIFWRNIDDCVPIGAIPNALLNDDTFLNNLGIAPLGQHIRSRILNTSCLTSTNPRYITFCNDVLLNRGLRGQDSRVLMSRAMLAGGITMGGVNMKSKELDPATLYDVDLLDSRPVVQKLSAALGEEQATYFFTCSCNQKEHFGISELKEWIDSEKAIDSQCD